MAACWIKGKRRIIGRNRLTDPARLKRSYYTEIHGRHCELHVVLKSQWLGQSLKGGTLYVTGVRSKNGRLMSTTEPCRHCRKLIAETQIKYLVYWRDHTLIKELL